MRMYTQCLPCIVSGCLDTVRLVTDDEILQQTVLKKVMKALADADTQNPPPLMALNIQNAIRTVTGVADPYAAIKKKYNDFALSLYPELEKKVDDSTFETAVRLCIAGNIIDFATHTTQWQTLVQQTIDHALTMDINGKSAQFESACTKAQKILWVADNAGEIVFDKLLLKKLADKQVIYAVRGGPTQNDATLEDARYTGIDKIVPVIDTGAALPGVILERCSDEFRQAFEIADLIISKGQGNFETLDHSDERIFFLFKAKCRVIANHAGCRLNDIVIKKGGS